MRNTKWLVLFLTVWTLHARGGPAEIAVGVVLPNGEKANAIVFVQDAEAPANDLSRVSTPRYLMRVVGSPVVFKLTADQYRNLIAVRDEFEGIGKWKVRRRTGGYACGAFDFPVIDMSSGGVVGARFRFPDFARYKVDSNGKPMTNPKTGDPISDPHADPYLTADFRYEYANDYTKEIFFADFKDGRPVFNDGMPGRFEKMLPANIKDQRFVLDFGREKIVPVYVLGYRDGNAIFISPDDLQRLERGNPGDLVDITRYEVPSDMLRIANDADHRRASLEYIDDRGTTPRDEIIKANKRPLRGMGPERDRLTVGETGINDTIAFYRNHKSLGLAVGDLCDGSLGDVPQGGTPKSGATPAHP